jgi:hypothetical protein
MSAGSRRIKVSPFRGYHWKQNMVIVMWQMSMPGLSARKDFFRQGHSERERPNPNNMNRRRQCCLANIVAFATCSCEYYIARPSPRFDLRQSARLAMLVGLHWYLKSNTNSTLLLADTDRATSPARSLRVLPSDPQSPVMS